MPGVNWIPGISQLKSVVQLVTGDVDGAAQTQLDFFQECPIVSQVTSVVQLSVGETGAALATQKKCLKTVSNVADGIPVVGHVKGVVHHIVGDEKGGNRALNAATRSTVVIGSGVAAGIASGGLMGIPAGIAAGTAYDTANSIIANKPKGFYSALDNAVNNPSGGSIFDTVMVPVGDGFAGYGGGKMGESVGNSITVRKIETVRAAKQDLIDHALFDEPSSNGGGGSGGGGGGARQMTSAKLQKLGQEVNVLTEKIDTARGYVRSNGKGAAGGTYKTTKNGAYASSSTMTTRKNRPSLEKHCWYDYITEKVVIASCAPNKYCELVIANFDDSASLSILEQLAELYATQQRDAYNPKFRKDTGSYDTREKRSKRIDYFDDAKPDQTVGKLYPNVPVRFYRDPNEPPRTIEDSSPSSRKPFLLALRTPDQFKYSTLIAANSATQGLLHALIRHGDQFEQLGLSNDIINILPENMLVRRIRRENSRQSNLTFQDHLFEIDHSDYQRVLDLQLELHKAIQKLFKYDNYLGEGVNNNGQLQVYWRVNSNTVMVTAMSEQLLQEERLTYYDESGRQRPLRNIITVFLITTEEFQKKKDYGPIKRSG